MLWKECTIIVLKYHHKSTKFLFVTKWVKKNYDVMWLSYTSVVLRKWIAVKGWSTSFYWQEFQDVNNFHKTLQLTLDTINLHFLLDCYLPGNLLVVQSNASLLKFACRKQFLMTLKESFILHSLAITAICASLIFVFL